MASPDAIDEISDYPPPPAVRVKLNTVAQRRFNAELAEACTRLHGRKKMRHVRSVRSWPNILMWIARIHAKRRIGKNAIALHLKAKADGAFSERPCVDA